MQMHNSRCTVQMSSQRTDGYAVMFTPKKHQPERLAPLVNSGHVHPSPSIQVHPTICGTKETRYRLVPGWNLLALLGTQFELARAVTFSA